MKTFLFLTVALFSISAAIAADPPTQPTVDSTKITLAKITLGMTRKEAEVILGPDWKLGISAGWNSGQHAFYKNAKLPGYEVGIHYDWAGERGIGRHSNPEDPVIQLPFLKPPDPDS